MSKAKVGTRPTESTRKKLSLARMGNQNAKGNKNRLGKKHTQETKDKIRQTLLRKKKRC